MHSHDLDSEPISPFTTDVLTISTSSEFTINLDEISTIDLSSLSNISFNSGGGSYSTNYGGPYHIPNNFHTSAIGASGSPSLQPNLSVKGDAEIDGDIKWKGRSLGTLLETIEKRLNILVPDPEKLEYFESLKKAYDHYKTLEALCEIPKKEEE